MFCHKCGTELPEDALFCVKCGISVMNVTAKASGTPPNTVQNKQPHVRTQEVHKEKKLAPIDTKSSQANQIVHLLNKHLRTVVQSEPELFLLPDDWETIEQFPQENMENFAAGKPLLAFNYMNRGMEDGFIITETKFSYIYGRYGSTFNLQEILYAESAKKGLSTIMLLNFSDHTYSQDIYLTGIRDCQQFIKHFNSFLKEINQPEEYRKEQQRLASKDIHTILSSTFDGYCGESMYCYIGNPLSPRSSKYNAAIKNYNLDSEVEIYFIYDESILSNCKKGFVVTNNGIYLTHKRAIEYISWENFKALPLSASLTFSIGDYEFATSKKDCNIAYTTLSNIQKLLNA